MKARAMSWACGAVVVIGSVALGIHPAAAVTGPPCVTLAIGPTQTLTACVGLAPKSATNPVGTSHTVVPSLSFTQTDTAPLTVTPPPGISVDIVVLSGPNAGTTGTTPATFTCGPPALSVTCSASTTFTYTDASGAGTDTIQACVATGAPPGLGLPPFLCDTATKIWAPVPPQPEFPGIAFAIGGQGGSTAPCDPDTCPTGDDSAPLGRSAAERDAADAEMD
jgi:hypothetical protein